MPRKIIETAVASGIGLGMASIAVKGFKALNAPAGRKKKKHKKRKGVKKK